MSTDWPRELHRAEAAVTGAPVLRDMLDAATRARELTIGLQSVAQGAEIAWQHFDRAGQERCRVRAARALRRIAADAAELADDMEGMRI